MKIKFLGGSTFVIKSGETTLVLDPTSDRSLKQKKTEADICVITDPRYADNSNVGPVNPEKPCFMINGQGEYEVGGIFIEVMAYHGKETSKDKDLIAKIRAEGVNILYVGYANTPLTKEEIKDFNTVDILITPVGNKDFLSHDAVDDIVSASDPYVLVPALYQEGGAHSSIKELDTLDSFLKFLGTKEAEHENVLTIKVDDFDPDAEAPMRIVVLEKE